MCLWPTAIYTIPKFGGNHCLVSNITIISMFLKIALNIFMFLFNPHHTINSQNRFLSNSNWLNCKQNDYEGRYTCTMVTIDLLKHLTLSLFLEPFLLIIYH